MSKWEWKEFEDCIERVKYTTKIPSKDYLQEGEFPIVSQEDCLISGYWNDRSDLFKVTKPIVIFGDHTKVLKYIDFDFVLGADGVKILCPKDYLNAHFFFYFLKNVNFDNLGYARHYRLLKELSVPIPPLSEQKRIVKFLDEEFSKIDTLKTNAETNLKNAKELFETTLEKELNPLSRHSERSEESRADLPTGWEWKKIGDFCETSSGGTPLKQHNEYYENGNIPWLRSGEVCQKEIFETEMYITQKGMENSSAKYFPENSVVVAMYGATAGQVGIVRFRTTTNQAVCGIFPNEKYKTEYLYYALLSKKKELVAQAVGGAQPNISQIKIRNLQIPLPPLSVQKEIVARLDKLSENVKRLEANYKQIIADCDELKKSILKKTFEGES
ncbi:MAG: restriction endonuclease subunit S [Fibrobacter sp.]|nr:restriction endonuclease subunit S [Fibrobacter sp.]